MNLLESSGAILAELIAFPTVSKDSNLELISYCAKRFEDIGARCEWSYDESKLKANLFATIGPDIDGGIILSGHTDVVPVEGQDWHTDPFLATPKDGRIYGRGSCDMKGFIACALALAPRFAEARLTRPIHFALTFDEETSGLGAPVLLETLRQSGRKPAICIVGEPTDMKIVQAHKGMGEYTTYFTGLAGHGSDPERGVSALEYAILYGNELLRLREALQARAPKHSPFLPPYSSLQLGRMVGGGSHNVIAASCELDWEMRPLSPDDKDFLLQAIDAYARDELLPAMRAVYPEADIERKLVGEMEPLEARPDCRASALLAKLTGSNAVEVVSFGTEAGMFQEQGIDTVVCGPGSITQAHTANEFVEISQLQACLAMLEGLVAEMQD